MKKRMFFKRRIIIQQLTQNLKLSKNKNKQNKTNENSKFSNLSKELKP